MTTQLPMDECLVQAIEKIKKYIEKTTGIAPDPCELANAMTRFFVLKEIGEFIEMERLEQEKP